MNVLENSPYILGLKSAEGQKDEINPFIEGSEEYEEFERGRYNATVLFYDGMI